MKKMAILLILFALIGYTAFSITIPDDIPSNTLECSNDAGRCYKTIVSRVIDGDTIRVTDDNSIRFALSSAPELSEQGGKEAKEFIESICPVGSSAIIDEDDKQTDGSYGRIIAKITCNGINLNESLIENNHGVIDTRYCNSEFLDELWALKCAS